MKWAWKIAEIGGVSVRIHATFLLLLAWIGLSAWAEGTAIDAARGVAFAVLVFAIIVLHELGHAAAARRYGIRTRDITLLPIGGVARLDRMPDDPRAELVIALAGPAVNVVLVVLLAGTAALLGQPLVPDSSGLADGPVDATSTELPMIARLAWVNFALAAFNLLPAFPMDGGRALRAVLATRMDHARATRIAAGLGQTLALLLGFIGLFASPVLVFVALFVWLGAAAENSVEQLHLATRGLHVADAMVRHFEAVASDDTLATATEHVLAGFQTHFPVLEAGRIVGVLSHGDLIRGLAEHGAGAPIAAVMRRDARVLDAREPLERGLEQLDACACPALPVVDAGRLVGMLTLESVGELVTIRTAIETAQRPRRALARGWPQPRRS